MEMPNQSIFVRYPKACGVIVMLVTTVVLLLAMEFGFRWVRDVLKGSPWDARAENVDDADLGWSLNPQKQRVVKTNACGETVIRDTPAGRYLNRVPGTSRGQTVLFVGDSFTQGTEVSTDSLYYMHFETGSKGNFRVFAAGVGGYSSAQEYLLMQKVLASVRPSIIFWQLTSNDVAENVYIGTDLSTVQNQRPYYDLDTDRFVMRDPSNWLLRRSELAKYLLGEMLKVDRRHDLGLYAFLLGAAPAPTGVAEQRRLAGLAVLERMVAKVVRENPGVILVGFAADQASPPEYREIFEKHGALYVASLLADLHRGGRKVDCAPVDAHWNHAGNRIAGQLLADFARDHILTQPGRGK